MQFLQVSVLRSCINQSIQDEMSKSENSDNEERVETDQIESDEAAKMPAEVGGPKGKEPTRYGDWEKNGRCIDF